MQELYEIYNLAKSSRSRISIYTLSRSGQITVPQGPQSMKTIFIKTCNIGCLRTAHASDHQILNLTSSSGFGLTPENERQIWSVFRCTYNTNLSISPNLDKSHYPLYTLQPVMYLADRHSTDFLGYNRQSSKYLSLNFRTNF